MFGVYLFKLFFLFSYRNNFGCFCNLVSLSIREMLDIEYYLKYVYIVSKWWWSKLIYEKWKVNRFCELWIVNRFKF